MTQISMVVVGSANMDFTLKVREFPRPGETITAREFDTRPGGKGANQAIAAARLGAKVSIFAAIGTDEHAPSLRRALEENVVSTTHLVDVPGSSGIAVITIDRRGENTVTVAPGANAALSVPHLEGLVDALAGCSFLLLQLEVPMPTVLEAARVAREQGVRVMLNAAPLSQWPHPELAAILQLVDVLVVNETEAAMLGAPSADPQGAEFLRSLGPAAVVITVGEHGAAAAHREGAEHVASIVVEAIDTVGAGDSFCAELAVALSDGLSLPAAVRRGNVAGALATTKHGSLSAVPLRSEVDRVLAEVEAG